MARAAASQYSDSGDGREEDERVAAKRMRGQRKSVGSEGGGGEGGGVGGGESN